MFDFYNTTKDLDHKKQSADNTVSISEVIKMSQDISKDWLEKVAEKKEIIQETVQEEINKKRNVL